MAATGGGNRRGWLVKGPVAALGIFDGVHRGHQAILRRAVREAARFGASPMALTFYPHPARVVTPARAPVPLLSIPQRLAAMKVCGVHRVLVVRFTRAFSRWAPERFVEQILFRRLGVSAVFVGHDFRFGRGRSGTVRTLRRQARQLGFQVAVVPPVRVGRVRVSSRVIRRVIARGRLTLARRYLGYPPCVVGRVVAGAGRGGPRLGAPTANLRWLAGVLPPNGVYAVWVRWGDTSLAGVANLGVRPTFGARRSARPLLEVHCFAPQRLALRGRTLVVAFARRLRAERKFPTAAALRAQIHRDKGIARRWLGRVPPPWFPGHAA